MQNPLFGLMNSFGNNNNNNQQMNMNQLNAMNQNSLQTNINCFTWNKHKKLKLYECRRSKKCDS